jgi:hypothetical protein
MLLIVLIDLVDVGGINTSLFSVSIMMMLPYLLILKEIMTFMMWNKLKNLLLRRVHSNLLICLIREVDVQPSHPGLRSEPSSLG